MEQSAAHRVLRAAGAPSLARFADELSEEEIQAYTSGVLGSASAASAAHQLGEGVAALETALRAEVLSRHTELVQHVSSLCDTAGTLSSLRLGVETLQAAMQRVRAEIAEPHRHIASRTLQLAALSRSVELLHAVVRMLKLNAKLRESMGASGDLARTAKTLSELQALQGEVDLAGVAVVDAELPFLARAAAEVRAEAASALQRGLDGMSQSACPVPLVCCGWQRRGR